MINHRYSTKLTIIAGFLFACGALVPLQADADWWFPKDKAETAATPASADARWQVVSRADARGDDDASVWTKSKRWFGSLFGGENTGAKLPDIEPQGATFLYEEQVRSDAIAFDPDAFSAQFAQDDMNRAAVRRSDMSAAVLSVVPTAIEEPLWNRNAVPVAHLRADKPMIAIVIDDLGIDRRRSEITAQLPAPLTLAWLPYANELPEQTQAAHKRGHELMIHMPMEPLNEHIDPGPNALRVGLSAEELRKRLTINLATFDGYVGINNHMGSRFTQDAEGMALVMDVLRKHDLLYLDSRTIRDSVAEKTAQDYNVPTTSRDVFLDHYETSEAVHEALAHLEKIAGEHGTAVAIGHPKDVTLSALAEWLPSARARGFQLVPLSAIVKEREGRFMQARDKPADKVPGDVTLLVPQARGVVQ